MDRHFSDLPDVAHARTEKEILATLQSSESGLAQAEALARVELHGPNQLPEPETAGIYRLFLLQFLSPLIYVLLAAAVVSLMLGEYTDAAFITAVLVINAIIGTAQEYHAHKSAEALRKMVQARAVVLRDGDSFEIDAMGLVPGDIVLLDSGSKVPADMRLLHTFDLEVDESLLTGESVPVQKQLSTSLALETPMADRINMLFSGTLVNRGRARAVVTATGINTAVGRLAEAMQQCDAAKAPLIQRMERFTVNIAVALGIAVLLLAAVEFNNGVSWHEIFIVSVALAVSAIPEGLPVALTVALAIGMNRMARRKVIVRRLVAVEALGSCTVIASDKTGTLTMNQLTVRRIAMPLSDAWKVSGGSNTPDGSVNTEAGALSESQASQMHILCRTAALCNEGFFGQRDGQWISHGDAVDVALLVMAHKLGMRQAGLEQRYPELASIPYESEFGYAASLHEDGDQKLILVKGALERLIPMCETMLTDDGEQRIEPDMLEQQLESLAVDGYRTLAFAEGRSGNRTETGDFSREHLTGLRLLGLVGMIDPLRVEAKEAVEECHKAGIRVCMITGDHPSTAYAIAHEIGLVDRMEQVVSGSQLSQVEKLGQSQVDALVDDANVFARVEPSQKVDIVWSLQRSGHFVAVTGDGVNDAPALTASHVGVAMGKQGTDVARESADLVVADDNFASIVAGVEEGRVAYRNIRKVIFLLISTGAAELVLFFLSLAFAMPLPLTAVQLLWLNLVTNGIQDVALAFEAREGNEMQQPPRNPKEPIFNRMMLERTLISAAIIGMLAFLTFQNLLSVGMSIDEARNSTLLLMVLFENVHAFNSRSEQRSVFNHNPLLNPLLLFGTLAAQLIHIGAMYVPGLSSVLGIQPVSFAQWLELLPVALVILMVMECHKWVRHTWPIKSDRAATS